MTKVRMLADISGSRNGVDWPKRGEIVDLPDDEATDLITAGMAAKASDKDAEKETKTSGPLTTETGPVESAAVDTTPKKK